ncbi:protein PIF-like [Liolophura sinensis]|uniref:protein PIF-like n=1 Tax=Liolophura sinensis TaxID=3198878 RepID=UPI0031585A58
MTSRIVSTTPSTAIRTTPTAEKTTPGSDPCVDCLFLNGIGYNPHPENCQFFYQCIPRGFVLVPFVKSCPAGEFWDHSKLSCAPAATVICPIDPCRFNSSLESYAYSGNCNAYWRCQLGFTWRTECCAVGESYIPGQGCTSSVPCPDRCPFIPSAVPSTTAEPCNKRAVPGEQTKYFEQLTRRWEIERECAPNTGFSPETCSCSIVITPPGARPTDVCRPFLYLPFDNDLKDHSENRLSVKVEGAVILNKNSSFGNVGDGSACFDGSSRLLIYSFAGRDYGRKFLLRFRYREAKRNTSTNGVSEALVTNADCFSPPSVIVSFNRSESTTTGRLRTALSNRQSTIDNVEVYFNCFPDET